MIKLLGLLLRASWHCTSLGSEHRRVGNSYAELSYRGSVPCEVITSGFTGAGDKPDMWKQLLKNSVNG